MPILNHKDYRSSRAQLVQLRQAVGPSRVIADLAAHAPANVTAARQQAIKSEIERVEREIADYERLREQRADLESEIAATELGMLPIIARIARQMSQRELAELLGMKEQQIQRYESDRYSGISLGRFENLLHTLGVELLPRFSAGWEGLKGINESQEVVSPKLAREILKRGWLDLPLDSRDEEVARVVSDFIAKADRLARCKGFHRRSPAAKSSETTDRALRAWRARVLSIASERRSRMRGKFNLADTSWLSRLVTLSIYPDGPRRAGELLQERGIVLVTEEHLPHTHLDGAAFLLLDSTPVIGLTLRHDRLDNFWFTLLHEAAHIYLHFNRGLDRGFLDEDVDGSSKEDAEVEADSFAQALLLPDEVWNSSPARFSKAPAMLQSFAESRNIHPAIVAGRIRRDRKNYTLFDDMVGRGQVRRLFLPEIAAG